MNAVRENMFFWVAAAGAIAWAVQPNPGSENIRRELDEYYDRERRRKDALNKTEIEIARAKALRSAGMSEEEIAAANTKK